MGSFKRVLILFPFLFMLSSCATMDEDAADGDEVADLSEPEDFSDEEVVSDDSDAPTAEDAEEEAQKEVAQEEEETNPEEEAQKEEEQQKVAEEEEKKEEEPEQVVEQAPAPVPEEEPPGGKVAELAPEIKPVPVEKVEPTPPAPLPLKSEIPSENKALANFLAGQTKFSGRRISIEAQDEDLINIFRLISEESGVNLVLDEEVGGRVTVKLRKIPWDQALTVIMKTKGLGFVREGNILRVSTLAKLKQEADLAVQLADARNKSDPLKVKIIPVSYANVTAISDQVKNFLSERGKVATDNRTNSLIVTDIQAVTDRIVRLVKTLDVPPDQVLIEGKIVEAQETFQRSIGVQWGGSGVPATIGSNKQGGTVYLTPSLSIAPASPAQGGLNFNMRVGSLDYLGDLTAALSLYETEQLVKVISAPRITTMNREIAEISQQVQIPIETVTVTTPGTPAQRSIRFEPAELKLEVTPQVTADGSVIMDLNVRREFFGAATGPNRDRAKHTRHARTKITVRSGQTAVIGGIFDNQETQGEDGVPWLRKLPVIGWLFKSQSTTHDKNELIIFLTPRVMSRLEAGEEGK